MALSGVSVPIERTIIAASAPIPLVFTVHPVNWFLGYELDRLNILLARRASVQCRRMLRSSTIDRSGAVFLFRVQAFFSEPPRPQRTSSLMAGNVTAFCERCLCERNEELTQLKSWCSEGLAQWRAGTVKSWCSEGLAQWRKPPRFVQPSGAHLSTGSRAHFHPKGNTWP